MLDHRGFAVIARPGFNASVAGSLSAEAISWRYAEIASLSVAMTLLIVTVVRH